MHKPNHFQRAYIGRFWYFDVSKVSGAWNFAFRSFSNIGHLLHHTRPNTLTAMNPSCFLLWCHWSVLTLLLFSLQIDHQPVDYILYIATYPDKMPYRCPWELGASFLYRPPDLQIGSKQELEDHNSQVWHWNEPSLLFAFVSLTQAAIVFFDHQ